MNKGITVSRRSPDGKTFNSDFARLEELRGECASAVTCANSGAGLNVQHTNMVLVIGRMDNTQDHTFESANRVYDTKGISPTINTCGGGGLQPMIVGKRYDLHKG